MHRYWEILLEVEGPSPDGFNEVWLSVNGRFVSSCVSGGAIDGRAVVEWAKAEVRRRC